MGLSTEATKVVENLWASGYIMPVVKSVELIAGILFLFNKYVQFACIIIMPVILNILILAIFKDPMGLVLSVPMMAMLLYLVKVKWKHYQYLLVDDIKN